MFETAAVARSSGRHPLDAKTFFISLAAHLAAIGVASLSALTVVTFPATAPPLIRPYIAASTPVALPPSPPPPKQASTPSRPVVSREILFAPTVIPDTIPVVPPAGEAPPEPIVDTATESGVEGGMEGAPSGETQSGAAAGSPDGTPGAVEGPHVVGNQLVFPLDWKLPLIATSQVYPDYPEQCRKKNLESTVVVRYVIDVRGRVREASIIRPSDVSPLFDKSVLVAIRNWRFRPYEYNGQVIEVSHELTVFFKLHDVKPLKGG